MAAREYEKQVGEAVQVDGCERVHPLAPGGLAHLALGTAADSARDVEPRGGLAATREDEALQLGEALVDLVAVALEPVDPLLRDAQPRVALDEGNRHVGAEVEELVLDPRESLVVDLAANPAEKRVQLVDDAEGLHERVELGDA